jgi:hypothetical protein
MDDPSRVDGALIQWGDRLFYPANRIVSARAQPRLSGLQARQRAAEIRARIEAIAVRRAPQVMVKVTGGGRGMKAIAAHFRYISKNGRLDVEDENGTTVRGRDAVRELADDWRFGGSFIDDTSDRREAFNIILSMPRGSAQPLVVLNAAREFAKAELAGHKYVMVLHDHQANPHVHISVRAESKSGRRLNPRKADLHRWRETFAGKLRGWGIDADATRRTARGVTRHYPELWQVKARQEGRLTRPPPANRQGTTGRTLRSGAQEAWARIGQALSTSGDPRDQRLAQFVGRFVHELRSGQAVARPGPAQEARDLRGRGG